MMFKPYAVWAFRVHQNVPITNFLINPLTLFKCFLSASLPGIRMFLYLLSFQMLEILNIMLREVKARLLSLGIGLEVSEAIKDLVCQQGYDRSFGARPLRRAVTHYIEDVISEALLAGNYKPGDTAVVDVDASGNPFVTNGSDHSVHLSDAASTL